MTITLGSFTQMQTDAATASTAAARNRLSSAVTILEWMVEAEETGDLILGRFEGVTISLDVSDIEVDIEVDGETVSEPARVYRVRLEDDEHTGWWDFVDQTIRIPGGKMSGGKNRRQIRADSEISGGLIEALNEVEKARTALEALLA